MPAQVDEVLLERRAEPRVGSAVGRDPRVDRVEVLDYVVHGEPAQPEALVLEALRDVEGVGDERLRARQKS